MTGSYVTALALGVTMIGWAADGSPLIALLPAATFIAWGFRWL